MTNAGKRRVQTDEEIQQMVLEVNIGARKGDHLTYTQLAYNLIQFATTTPTGDQNPASGQPGVA